MHNRRPSLHALTEVNVANGKHEEQNCDCDKN
jgi:hypothetical protein